MRVFRAVARRLTPRVFAAVALVVSPSAASARQQPAPAPPRAPTAYEELQTFSAVLSQIRANYVDSVTYHELVDAAIDGMLHALDPHSRYLSRADWERQSAFIRGELPAVGVQIEEEDGAATVIAVDAGTPAAKAGVQPGDRIAAINDTSVAGLKLVDVALRLTGPRGTTVRVRIERGPRMEPDTASVTLKRELLPVPSLTVSRMADEITGFVRLAWFGPKAADELRDAINRLHGQGARRIVLDVRDNPGGIMDAAVDVASEFLPRGTLVFRTEGREQGASQEYLTKRDGRFRDVPLIVLINGYTASAAEALAGSLQDHDRALILGRRSFGKALVQTGFLLLPAGDVLELTIARVFTPGGRLIQRRYRGIGFEQYWSFAGQPGAPDDTLATFRTDHGREMRGGGGIVPDVSLPAPSDLPAWWSAAADSGLADAVADSVAHTLPPVAGARERWIVDRQQWRERLLAPFLDRVRGRLHVRA